MSLLRLHFGRFFVFFNNLRDGLLARVAKPRVPQGGHPQVGVFPRRLAPQLRVPHLGLFLLRKVAISLDSKANPFICLILEPRKQLSAQFLKLFLLVGLISRVARTLRSCFGLSNS